MSAMCSGRLERFSPLRCSASLSIDRMSPTNSRRFWSRASRKTSNSLGENPAWFFPGLLRGGGGGGMIVGANLAAFPLLGLTSGDERPSFAGDLEDDPTGVPAADLVVPFIFAGLRGGVVRAMGRAVGRRAAFFF